MSSPLVEGWGDFLSQFRWDWFVTLTFNFDVKTFTAHNRCASWLRQLEKASEAPIAWFRGDEYGDRTGRFHMHLLVANVGHMGRFAWMRRWERDNGFARILPFDPAKGAPFYVAKYVTKQLGDYDMSDNLEAFRIQQPVLKLVGQRVELSPGSLPEISRRAMGSRRHREIPVTRQLPLSDFRIPEIDESDPDPIRESFREQTTLRRK